VAQWPQYMKRELKREEHEEIVRAIAAGDRLKATNIYLSATEGNLTEAQNFIKALTAEAEAAETKRSSKKSR
jgi:DNA-binding GntR family transcriptional regulator